MVTPFPAIRNDVLYVINAVSVRNPNRLCERSAAIQNLSYPKGVRGIYKKQNLWIATPLTVAREDEL